MSQTMSILSLIGALGLLTFAFVEVLPEAKSSVGLRQCFLAGLLTLIAIMTVIDVHAKITR